MAAAGDALPPPRQRQWPAHEVLDPATAIALACPGCALPWQVHPDLAGFRLRCECGQYLTVPKLVPALPAPSEDPAVPMPAPAPAPTLAVDAQGLTTVPLTRGRETDQPMPLHLAMAPATVQFGNLAVRTRWTNAAFLELALLMSAFLLPHLLLSLLLDGEARALSLPFVSMATGVIVVLIAAVSSPYAFRALRPAAGKWWLLAAASAFAAAALAIGYSQVIDVHDEGGKLLRGLRDTLTVGWSLFVIALCPALFEELAFRGVVQGRFLALLGAQQGLWATGAAFGLCHGITAALPFHIGLGVWFGWLRERSNSLLPGMLAHALYNGTLVLAA
jgi:membrane protease YdiL (CAAX protease family)